MAHRMLLQHTYTWQVGVRRRAPTPSAAQQAQHRLKVVANSSAGDQDHRARSQHGKQFESRTRRRGRPAWMRSPYDSPLRDGNRDRLIGLLTERAAKTLMIYLMETNANVYSWLVNFYKENPIPRNGSWDEVSGEAFLRKLLSMPIEEAKYNTGRDSLFDNVRSCGVDPRSIAQRIMEIRTQLSQEFIQELQAVAEENSVLLRETLQSSLSTAVNPEQLPTAHAKLKPLAPNSSNGSSSSNDNSSNDSSKQQRPSFSAKKIIKPDRKVSTPAQSWRRYRPPGTYEPSVAAGNGSGSDDSSSPISDADKAAALAALNAALKASTDLPAGAAGSHPELQLPGAAGGVDGTSSTGEDTVAGSGGSADGQFDMQEVIAQLQRSLDADVASLTNWDAPAAAAAANESEDATIIAAAGGGEEQEPAGQLPEEEQVTLQDALTTAAATAAVEAMESAAADIAAADLQEELQEEEGEVSLEDAIIDAAATATFEAMEALAADELANSMPELVGDAVAAVAEPVVEAAGEEEALGFDVPQFIQATVGPDNSRLPKGWGPRLGVGFSQLPACNNIVSIKQLTSKATPAAVTAADASAEQQ